MSKCAACAAAAAQPETPSALRRAVMVDGLPAAQVFVEGQGAALYRLGPQLHFGKLAEADKKKRRAAYDELVAAGLPLFAAYQFPEFAGE